MSRVPKRSNIRIATLSEPQSALVQALLYFDIFSYPLTAEELYRSVCLPDLNLEQVQSCLKTLVSEGFIGEEEGFFFVKDDQEKINRRKQGNAEAARRIPKALKVSRFIGKFPYVRGVMLSGSLSKNYMEKDSDIDYFIVTKPGRLWISRTLLILYKKIFLFNSHRNFCVNYFVDSNHLEIEDKNQFTATEVTFILPSYNYQLYEDFRTANGWTQQFYPNYGLRDEYPCPGINRSWIRRSIESVLNSRLGERLDTWCMKRTLKRWQHKFSDLDQEQFEIALRSRKYVSKHHPRRFQQVVTNKLAEKKSIFEAQFGIKLSQ